MTLNQPALPPAPRCQGLGDIALHKGIKHVNSYQQSQLEEEGAEGLELDGGPALDPELAQEPLLGLLLGVLQRWEEGLESIAAKGKRARGGAAGAAVLDGRTGSLLAQGVQAVADGGAGACCTNGGSSRHQEQQQKLQSQ